MSEQPDPEPVEQPRDDAVLTDDSGVAADPAPDQPETDQPETDQPAGPDGGDAEPGAEGDLEVEPEPESEPEPEPVILDAVNDPEGALTRAAELLADGEVVVIPTDTVYGVAADAFSRKAVQALLEAKGRGRDKPPPVLISDAPMLQALGDKVPSYARKLVDKYWPGPMTVVVKAQDGMRMELGETKGTIGLRVPDHDLTRDLLRRTGALAVSSANRTDQPPAHSVAEAVEQLRGHVTYYLDAGPLEEGPSSTMVNFSSGHYGELLRLGPHTFAELRETCPFLKDPMELAPAEPDDESDADGDGNGDATATPSVAEPAESTDAESTDAESTDADSDGAEPAGSPEAGSTEAGSPDMGATDDAESTPPTPAVADATEETDEPVAPPPGYSPS